MTDHQILQNAINEYGKKSQLEMAQEEATELALAVRKYIRNKNVNTTADLFAEVADVLIMIDQLEIMIPNFSECVSAQKKFKINRLKKRLKL